MVMNSVRRLAHGAGGFRLMPVMAVILFAAFQLEAAQLVSDELEVAVSEEFPLISSYTWRASKVVMEGCTTPMNTIVINGREYTPKVTFKQAGSDSVTYALSIPEISVSMQIKVSVEGDVVDYRFTQIKESGDTLLKTIELPQGFLSVGADQSGAAYAMGSIRGKDKFVSVDAKCKNMQADNDYAILNTDKLAASIANNSIRDWVRFSISVEGEGSKKRCTGANNSWIYREIDTEIVELPNVQVVITPEINGDGEVTWQDGAVAYRKIMVQRKGTEFLRSSFSHVAINFASVAQWPFTRVLDNIKKLYLYTDGFGQMLLIKGYGAEGHDSSHPDYGNNFNRGAGGLEDFNMLCKKAKDYNTQIGVHINHSEAYPEAQAYCDELLTGRKGWSWLDKSMKIDRHADIVAGNMQARLYELRDNAPNLSFIYVDTYAGTNWVAWKLGETLYECGWPVWTEFHPNLNNYAIWTHWAGGGQIARFVNNADRDVYGSNKILKGAKHCGMMGWDHGGYEKNIHHVIETFMTQNLPSKYIQNHDLLRLEKDFAIFADGLEVRSEGPEVNMTKNGRLIATGNTVFIPWNPQTEEKIYHWNPEGGSTTWKLPESWGGLKNVAVYELTDLGRVPAGTVKVADGKVAIKAKAHTPYVVYKKPAPKQQPMQWTEGLSVRDAGFDSHGFTVWSKADGASIRTDKKGQSVLHIEGSEKAVVSQKLSDLKAGANYVVSVWIEIDGKRKAGISIDNGGKVVENKITETGFMCNFPNSDKNGTYYQKVPVSFTAPKAGTPVVLSLVAGADQAGSIVRFDDVRVAATAADINTGHHYFEDFENTVGGWGPFVYGFNGPCKTHLSEEHRPYTKDTINGRYSLKTKEGVAGYVLQTLPSLLRFAPETTYKIRFKYLQDKENAHDVVVEEPAIDDLVYDVVKKVAIDSTADWKDSRKKAKVSVNKSKLTIKTTGKKDEGRVINTVMSPVAHGEVSFNAKINKSGKFALIFRNKSARGGGYAYIGYDGGTKWAWSSNNGGSRLTSDGPNVADDREHRFKLRFSGRHCKVWVDGELIYKGMIDSLPVAPGQIGFRTRGKTTLEVSDIQLATASEAIKLPEPLFRKTIKGTKGTFIATFTTGASAESFIAIKKLARGGDMLVIDDIVIDEVK